MSDNKPVMTREVAVKDASPSLRWIHFYASPDAVEGFMSFGLCEPMSSFGGDGYRLQVDPRYDFEEVLNYIKNYG